MESDIIDLHTHTDKSDGTLTPSELVQFAKKQNLKAIAITDHDTVAGIDEALMEASKLDIEIIVGVEISAFYGKEIHILGLFIDHKDQNLKKILGHLSENRANRNLVIIEQLNKLGIKIDISELPFQDDKSITRAHFARLLVEKGYCKNTSEANNKYLGFGAPAYVPRKKITPEESIKLIHRAGGLAFLAHLNQIDVQDQSELISLVSDLKEMGLDGIEGYYFEYDNEWTERCLEIADIFDLAICGGSDFHGSYKKNELGIVGENKHIPYSVLTKLKKRAMPVDIEDIV